MSNPHIQESPSDSGDSDMMTAAELGLYLRLGDGCPHRAAAAIRSRMRHGHPMPPAIRVPGHRARLWDRETVRRWLANYEAPARRRPGRPNKLDQLAMQREPSGEGAHHRA